MKTRKILLAVLLVMLLGLVLVSCGNLFHKHRPYYDAEVEPTCEEPGLSSGSHCSDCGEILEEQVEIPAYGHTSVRDRAVAPTCTTTGLTAGQHCAICNKVLVPQTIVEKVEHTYGWDDLCTECGHYRYAECAHINQYILEGWDATCQWSGWTDGMQCLDCDEIIIPQTYIPIKSHITVTDAAVEATCTSTGLTEGSHCSECGEIFVEQTVIPVIEHIASEWIIDKESNEFESGLKHQVCTVCGNTIKEEIIPQIVYLEYTVNSYSTTCTVTGIGTFSGTDLVIPEYLDGHRVTAISADAFYECSSLTSVVIPDSVTSIGREAFYGCSSLTSIVIPDSVTSIGMNAFRSCYNLASVYATSIESWVNIDFAFGEELERGYASNPCINGADLYIGTNKLMGDLVIPDGVTEIKSMAFAWCDTITSVVIPGSVTSIGDYAFQSCTNLESIKLGNGLHSIGFHAFYNCSKLTSVYVNDIKEWVEIWFDTGARINRHEYKTANPCYNGADLYVGNNKLTGEVVIPDGVQYINPYAFYNFDSITSVVIPDSVKQIGDYAFRGCINLMSVTIGNGVTQIDKYAFSSCGKLSNVTIGNSVWTIGIYAFEYCDSLMSIEIPDSVTYIDDYAFYKCSSLASLTMGNGINKIDKETFYACPISEVYIKDIEAWLKISFTDAISNPLYGGADLYLNNIKLTELIIPDNVTSIGDYAFQDCQSLITVVVPDHVTSIGKGAFIKCANLKNIVLGKGVRYMYDQAFYGCGSLESITVEEGNTVYHSAGNCLIRTEYKKLILGCKNSVIPTDGSVTAIDQGAFANCSGLTYIVIPNSVTRIGDFAFEFCDNLKSIVIPDSVTSIGSYIFTCCSSLTSVVISNSVTSIDFGLFYKCSSLTSINFNGTIARWSAISKMYSWDEGTGDYIVYCTDGNIYKS